MWYWCKYNSILVLLDWNILHHIRNPLCLISVTYFLYVAVICYWRCGTTYLWNEGCSWISWTFKMGAIFYPETSVRGYYSTLRNIPEQHRCFLRWKSEIIFSYRYRIETIKDIVKQLTYFYFGCFFTRHPLVDQGILINEVTNHTQRNTTVCKTSLDEWSASRKDNTDSTDNIQISTFPMEFDPTIPADLALKPRGYRDRHIVTLHSAMIFH
jgi:hypothetical protein